MNGRPAASAFWMLALGLFALVVACPREAKAEEHSIIKHPNDHPSYSVELEPHGIVSFNDGFGLGMRLSIPIVQNGFISTINNSVAIGFGFDWVHYDHCHWYWHDYADCRDLSVVWIPVVLQWNFFLSTHWSVFGEPGLAFEHDSIGPNGHNDTHFNPFIFFAGGRYHISEKFALVMRLELFPDPSLMFGPSWML